jgi:hypothetical protein
MRGGTGPSGRSRWPPSRTESALLSIQEPQRLTSLLVKPVDKGLVISMGDRSVFLVSIERGGQTEGFDLPIWPQLPPCSVGRRGEVVSVSTKQREGRDCWFRPSFCNLSPSKVTRRPYYRRLVNRGKTPLTAGPWSMLLSNQPSP